MKGLLFVFLAILFAGSANGTIRVLRRPYKNIQMCPDGLVPDQVFPDQDRFTCKPGPGSGKNVKCKTFPSTAGSFFQCPKHGYYSGWFHLGLKRMLKCCREPSKYIQCIFMEWDHSNKSCKPGRADVKTIRKSLSKTNRCIQYSRKDCRFVYNDKVLRGKIFRVDKGKFITTSWSPDGGVTWFTYQCAYNTSPRITYKDFFTHGGNW